MRGTCSPPVRHSPSATCPSRAGVTCNLRPSSLAAWRNSRMFERGSNTLQLLRPTAPRTLSSATNVPSTDSGGANNCKQGRIRSKATRGGICNTENPNGGGKEVRARRDEMDLQQGEGSYCRAGQDVESVLDVRGATNRDASSCKPPCGCPAGCSEGRRRWPGCRSPGASHCRRPRQQRRCGRDEGRWESSLRSR